MTVAANHALLRDVRRFADELLEAEAEAAKSRERFLRAVRFASEQGFTQLNIADASGYSRQRISQFLAKASAR